MAHSPLQAAFTRSSTRKLCVLAYHGVSDAEAFAVQLDWLSAQTTPVSVEDVRRALLEGQELPRRPVLVTLDDGERSVLEVAAPLLRERGIPAVAFAVAGLVDTDTPYWWTEIGYLARTGRATDVPGPELVRRLKQVPDAERRRTIVRLRELAGSTVRQPQLTGDELRKLELDGISVGNHTLSHPCLDRCDDETLEHEVRESHRRLTDILGHPPESFAYPNGNVDDRVRQAVQRTGYPVAFAFDHRLAEPPVDPLTVSRIRVDAAAGIDRFKILVSGLHAGLHRLRGRR